LKIKKSCQGRMLMLKVNWRTSKRQLKIWQWMVTRLKPKA